MHMKKWISKIIESTTFVWSLFRFHFISLLQHLDCYYNEYPVKQTVILYLEVSFETCFLSMFLLYFLNFCLCLKEYPHNLTKYVTNQTSNISISQLFIKLGKYWKCSIDLYSIFQILHELVRLRNPDNETFKNPKISLWPRKDSDIKHKTITQKITILNRCMNWEKLCPNLSFTFESKIRNLRRESYVLV